MNLKTTLKSAVKQKQRHCVKKENIKLKRSNFSYIIDVRSIFFKKIRACFFSQRNKFTIALKHIFFVEYFWWLLLAKQNQEYIYLRKIYYFFINLDHSLCFLIDHLIELKFASFGRIFSS